MDTENPYPWPKRLPPSTAHQWRRDVDHQTKPTTPLTTTNNPQEPNDSLDCLHKRSPSDQSHHHQSWRKKQVERPEKRRSATPKTHRCAQLKEERRCLKKHGDAPPIYQIWKMVPSIGAAQPLQSSHQSHCLKRRETRRTSFAPCVTTRRIPPTRDEEQARFEHHRSFKGEAEEIRERKGEEGEALSGHR